ncbi:hypothetical protein Pcinc_042363, partial [Petrolisthes cinctipes]
VVWLSDHLAVLEPTQTRSTASTHTHTYTQTHTEEIKPLTLDNTSGSSTRRNISERNE